MINSKWDKEFAFCCTETLVQFCPLPTTKHSFMDCQSGSTSWSVIIGDPGSPGGPTGPIEPGGPGEPGEPGGPVMVIGGIEVVLKITVGLSLWVVWIWTPEGSGWINWNLFLKYR